MKRLSKAIAGCLAAVILALSPAVPTVFPHEPTGHQTVLAATAAPKKAPAKAPANAKNAGKNIDPVTGKQVKQTSVVNYINAAYQWMAIFGGLLAVIMLIYAGFRYMTSYGDPEKISDAKDIIEKSLTGLALLILAAVILSTINPRTIQPCKPGQTGCGDIDFSKPNGK